MINPFRFNLKNKMLTEGKCFQKNPQQEVFNEC
jgi:hypothetical protein